MSCITLSGIARDCSTSMGGIKRAFIGERQNVTPYSVSGDSINAVTTSGTTSPNWKEFKFKKNTGSFTSTLNNDAANGVSYVSTEINLVFSRMETAKRIEMAALAVGDLVVIVEDSNGNAFAFGNDEPVLATGGTGETGVAKGDGNKYTITLTDESKTYPYQLTASAYTTFLESFAD